MTDQSFSLSLYNKILLTWVCVVLYYDFVGMHFYFNRLIVMRRWLFQHAYKIIEFTYKKGPLWLLSS